MSKTFISLLIVISLVLFKSEEIYAQRPAVGQRPSFSRQPSPAVMYVAPRPPVTVFAHPRPPVMYKAPNSVTVVVAPSQTTHMLFRREGVPMYGTTMLLNTHRGYQPIGAVLLFVIPGDTSNIEVRQAVDTGEIIIRNEYPGSGLGWGDEQYQIVDQNNNVYNIAARNVLPEVTVTGLIGGIVIYKYSGANNNRTVIFNNMPEPAAP